ncbi:PrsW family intramembrane metalloprotease [Chloroflexota bacterium]
MAFLITLLLGFIPMLFFAFFLYSIDRYEKEPGILLGAVFVWGAIVAAGGAFIINTVLGLGVFIFTSSEAATDLATGSLIAPLVEEVLKGLAVLIVFLIFRKEFDSILDGIIYAGVAALGFAASENTYYIYTYGYQQSGWEGILSMSFIRIILVGWQHPFYTAFIGIGLALNRMSKSLLVKIVAPIAGISLAVFTHSAHNSLASLLQGTAGLVFGTAIDWIGWFLMMCFIVWMILREKQTLKKYLFEEVQSGTITKTQFQAAISGWQQVSVIITALLSGKYKLTRRFYQLCGELAHKRRQLDKLGNEDGNIQMINTIRQELGQISSIV